MKVYELREALNCLGPSADNGWVLTLIQLCYCITGGILQDPNRTSLFLMNELFPLLDLDFVTHSRCSYSFCLVAHFTSFSVMTYLFQPMTYLFQPMTYLFSLWLTFFSLWLTFFILTIHLRLLLRLSGLVFWMLNWIFAGFDGQSVDVWCIRHWCHRSY